MQVTTRRIQLAGSHGQGERPCLARIVYVNHHVVEYRCFRDRAEEELVLNGTVIARYTAAQLDAGDDSRACSEGFEQLTGLWPHQWDRVYRQLCWPAYQGEDWYWDQVSPRRHRR
jgi:hypothetical protein